LRKRKQSFIALTQNLSGPFIKLIVSLYQFRVNAAFQFARNSDVNRLRFLLENGLGGHQLLKIRFRVVQDRCVVASAAVTDRVGAAGVVLLVTVPPVA
jgi:hypothetical protein